MSHRSLTRQAVCSVYVTPNFLVAGSALLILQAVSCVYVTPVSHIKGGSLRMCQIHLSHGGQCVTQMSHLSLTMQAVRQVYVTPVTHNAGDSLCMCHIHIRHSHIHIRHSHTQAVRYVYVYVTPVTHRVHGGRLNFLQFPRQARYIGGQGRV
jgi:hypothetical protein